MAYTIDQIDEALIRIKGHWAVRRSDSGWSRPHAIYDVAAQAWIKRWPEDEHTRVLREAIADLEVEGRLKPVDGTWPGEEG